MRSQWLLQLTLLQKLNLLQRLRQHSPNLLLKRNLHQRCLVSQLPHKH